MSFLLIVSMALLERLFQPHRCLFQAATACCFTPCFLRAINCQRSASAIPVVRNPAGLVTCLLKRLPVKCDGVGVLKEHVRFDCFQYVVETQCGYVFEMGHAGCPQGFQFFNAVVVNQVFHNVGRLIVADLFVLIVKAMYASAGCCGTCSARTPSLFSRI